MDIETKKLEDQSSYKIISFKASNFPETYRNMIYSKWLRSLRYGNEYFSLIDPKIYFEVYESYINSLLKRPLSIVKFAVLTDDPDVVLGWSLIEDNKLHYVYVQKDMRGQGIAQELCKEPFDTITHITLKALNIWNKHYKHVIFNPF